MAGWWEQWRERLRRQEWERAPRRFVWHIDIRSSSALEWSAEDLMLLLTVDQKVKLSVQPVDRAGNAAKVDGPPAWTLSDPSIGTLAVATDGLSATFSANKMGLTQVNVSADADLGNGVRTIAGALDIQVEAGEAVSLTVTAATPQPK